MNTSNLYIPPAHSESLLSKRGTKVYRTPQIERVELDNQISLQLQSEPPTYESMNTHHHQDILKINSFDHTI